jgi:serine/threonine-protein kinase RsbW
VDALLLQEAANWLDNDKSELAQIVSDKIYETVKSYRLGIMPIEESRSTVIKTLDSIISYMRDNRASLEQDTDTLISQIFSFQEGIATKRVTYLIELEDLLHGIRVVKDEVWNLIAKELGERPINASHFVQLEKRISRFFIHLMIRIAGSYNRAMADIIGHQESDLLKWEEVIKSASSIELKIPCRGEFAAIVRLQAEAIARRLKYTEEEVQDIKVAVGEACDNAIEHGLSDKGIDVHYHLSLDEMKVEIIDYGNGFDPSGKGDEPPDLFAERGRGIFLIKSLMDRTEIYSKPGEGSMTILAKKRFYR